MESHPQSLPLRDAHLPPPPAWWPPAPGWWLLFTLLLALVALGLFFRQRRHRRSRAWQALFDAADARESASARIATMSELLRRAAREVDANAVNLQGEDWLRFLDGKNPRGFVDGAGRALLDGAFRRDAGVEEADALAPVARARFLELMAGRR